MIESFFSLKVVLLRIQTMLKNLQYFKNARVHKTYPEAENFISERNLLILWIFFN